jgi:hypothetical protein
MRVDSRCAGGEWAVSDRRDESFASGAAETARLVQEVQDLGFQAARAIVERFVDLFAQFATGSYQGAPCREGSGTALGCWESDPSIRTLQQDLQRAADSYLALIGQLNQAGLRFLDAARQWQPPSAEHAGLRLPDVRPGGRVSARVWLHNTTATAAVNLRSWCLGLASHDGASLPPTAVTCTPERIDHLESGGSREVLVTVAVEDTATPGSYHGQLLVDGLPEAVFPLRVIVVADENDT